MEKVEILDPYKMYEQGCAFYDIGDICVKEPNPFKNRKKTHNVAGLTNFAFSCELFMKTIIVFKEINNKPYGHDLFELWMKIKEKENQLALLVEEKINSMYRSKQENLFDERLIVSKDKFEELRYIYEYSKIKCDPNFIKYLSTILKSVCEDLLNI